MNSVRHLSIAAAMLVTAGMFSGCGNGSQKDNLSGNLGPGSGGPAATTPSVPQQIATPNGTVIGQYIYDSMFFTPSTPDPTQIGVLTATSDPQLTISITHISGRPDTPCRFEAATLARDNALDIGDTGLRRNALGQDLYQVNLSGHGQYGQLFCAKLRDNAGAQFSISADAPDKVSWTLVYAVLNSLHVP